MKLAFAITVPVVFSNPVTTETRTACSSSAECGELNFCNFDETTSGFCESCSNAFYIPCDQQGFITQKGEEECKTECEINYWQQSTVPTVVRQEKAKLKNARFALYDKDSPFKIGKDVNSTNANQAIDGNFGYLENYHGAFVDSSNSDVDAVSSDDGSSVHAEFYVDLDELSIVDYVKIWPIKQDDHKYHYVGDIVHAHYVKETKTGDLLCNPRKDENGIKENYDDTRVKELIANKEPLIFECPTGAMAHTIRVTSGNDGQATGKHAELAEIEVFIDRKATLLNPRFAYYSDTIGEGDIVNSTSGHEAQKAIDGDKGLRFENNTNTINHGAFPDVPTASVDDPQKANFFVNLNKPSYVNFVHVWPKVIKENAAGDEAVYHYGGKILFVGETSCDPYDIQNQFDDDLYTTDKVKEDRVQGQLPLLFLCPEGTFGETIRLAPGYGPNDKHPGKYTELAEIEVYVERRASLSNPRFALIDTTKKNSEGTRVQDAVEAIDGKYTMDQTFAMPEGANAVGAHFFVDLSETIAVDYVLVWPRFRDEDNMSKHRYYGDIVYVGSTLCSAKEDYGNSNVNGLIEVKQDKPMVFNCPVGAVGSTIRLAPGAKSATSDTLIGEFAELAEIEVATKIEASIENEECTVPISSPKDGILKALTVLDRNNTLDIEELKLHGRWASRTLGKAITGSVIDDLDEIFRFWFIRRKCPLMLQGTCQDNSRDDEYTLVCSATGTEIADGNDDCKQKMYEIDSYHFNLVQDYMTRNATWVHTPAESEEQEGGKSKDSCCGLGVTDLKPFASATQECTAGKVTDKNA